MKDAAEYLESELRKALFENVALRARLARVYALTCDEIDLYDRPGDDTVTVAQIRAALNEETR